MVVSNSAKNLRVDVQGQTNQAKPGGAPLTRTITLYNDGKDPAELQLGIEPEDGRAEALLQWCSFDKSDADLRLEPGSETKVQLSFVVPRQAEAGYYSYQVVVVSPHYPNEIVRRPQQLQVLALQRDVQRSDPKITLIPASTSTEPHHLAPGGELVVVVAVDNPSLRTDRFFVACLDIEPDWYTVIYPESDTKRLGVVTRTDGLVLNQKQSGTVQLRIHPPPYTRAGNYSPTLKVTSNNRPELVMLEMVYFTVPVDDRLSLTIDPDRCILPSPEASFKLQLKNLGNVDRQIHLWAVDDEHKLDYLIETDDTNYGLLNGLLEPGQTLKARVQPQPRFPWQTLWRLKEQVISFAVHVENRTLDPTVDSSVPAAEDGKPLALSEPVKAQVYWSARRQWLAVLLAVLLVLGLFTGTVVLLWQWLVWRPSLRPRIVELSPGQETYQEKVDGESVGLALDWDITNPSQISQLELTAAESEEGREGTQLFLFGNDSATGETATSPIPPELRNYCKDDVEIERPSSPVANLLRLRREQLGMSPNIPVLRCRGVMPIAPKKDGEEEADTECNADVNSCENEIPQNNDPDSCENEIPQNNDPDNCENGISQAGSYQFTLKVFQGPSDTDADTNDQSNTNTNTNDQSNTNTNTNDQSNLPQQFIVFLRSLRPWLPDISIVPSKTELRNSTPIAIQVIDDVIVGPPPPPEIELFKTTASEYSVPTDDDNNTADAATVANPVAAIVDPRPPGPILLNWTVTNLRDIQQLQIVALDEEGRELLSPKNYVLINANGDPVSLPSDLPSDLRELCTTNDNTLTCDRVPTDAETVGEYTFQITVIPLRDRVDATDIIATTPPIPIKPPLPNILIFAVNGQAARERPKQVFPINPLRGSLDVHLRWEVEHATQVELLPAPGMVATSGSIPYTIGANPGTETLTLRAVNELGEEQTRIVVLEKFTFESLTPPGGNPIPGGNSLPPLPPPTPVPPIEVIPLPPAELPPAELPPAELPPRTN